MKEHRRYLLKANLLLLEAANCLRDAAQADSATERERLWFYELLDFVNIGAADTLKWSRAGGTAGKRGNPAKAGSGDDGP